MLLVFLFACPETGGATGDTKIEGGSESSLIVDRVMPTDRPLRHA